MAKNHAVWGIDLGQCALKALRCTTEGDAIVADKFDFIEYPKILSQADADPEELIREAISEFLSRNNVVGDSVAISVSGQAGLSRFFKPPPVDAKTLPEIVKYEVKQQIPFPIEDVIWDWQQLGGSVIDGRTVDAEVGLFAMKREAVFRALRPFDDADIEVDYVQLSPLSIFNVFCHDIIDELPDPEDFDPESPPDSLVVMSMGTDTTDLIVSNGIKLWLRNIPIGGNHFTKHLSRELKLTQAKAEHLKRNARQAENPKAVFKAMRPVFNDLVNEVQRSLTFFQSMEKSAEISKLVLLGNAAKLPGLRQYLNKQLEIDIAKVSEFENLTGAEVVGQKSFTDNLLSFAPCYGLCLQGLKKGKINTNLLPQEIVTERIIRAKKPWVLASVGAIMLGCLLGYFFKENAWWNVNDENKREGITWKAAKSKVTSESSKSSSFVEEDREQKLKLDKLTRLSDELLSASYDRTTWIEIVSAIYQAMPRDERIMESTSAGDRRVDPAVIEFEGRKELFIDHMETKYFKDLAEWHKDSKPVYETMIKKFVSDDDSNAALTEIAEEKGKEESSLITGQPGWVIELKGHHFHNSNQLVIQRNANRSYLTKTLINALIDGTVKFPGEENEIQGGGEYTFADFGIYYPTITDEWQTQEQIVFYREQNVKSKPEGEAEEGDEDADDGGSLVFDVNRYNFTIQMAWIPRSPEERFKLRAERLEKEAKEREAAEAAAEREQEQNK